MHLSVVEVDQWLGRVDDAEQRTTLEALRRTIREVARTAEEGISYAMPAHRDELKRFTVEKGTIRFRPAGPLPVELVARIVEDRMAEIDAKLAARR